MRAAVHDHLSPRRLLDLYAGSTEVPSESRAHLATCPECRARYAEMGAGFDTVRLDADLAADAAFSTARLDTQRHRIMARIAALGHGARVIPFPAASAGSRPARRVRILHRWVAAAAAAGLLLGLGLGRLPVLRPQSPKAVARASQRTATAIPSMSAARNSAPMSDTGVVSHDDDEAFLLALDEALSHNDVRIPELRVVDALTAPAFETVALKR